MFGERLHHPASFRPQTELVSVLVWLDLDEVLTIVDVRYESVLGIC